MIKLKKNSASILATAVIASSIAAGTVGYLLQYVSKDTMMVEKQIGYAKSQETLKLATYIYNTTIANNQGTINDDQVEDLTEIIGGGGDDTPIFGESSTSVTSNIPGFDQFGVVWDSFYNMTSSTMSPPSNDNGFWFFPGTMTATITSTHDGESVPIARKGTKATLSSVNQTQTVPVFSMLSFYDKDWEIAAHYESAQLLGHIHANGSIFLDCRSSGPDRISFHTLQNFPALSAEDAVYRRGRNGATSYYKFGSTANAGLDFYVYNSGNFASLISAIDFNYTNNSSRVFSRDMTPGYTSYEEGSENNDSGSEPVRRRFGGGTIGSDFGYVYTGTNHYSSNTFDAPDSTGTDTVAVVQFGDAVNELSPPVAINPYQYIEDIQYFDTPDTENYTPPTPSNYSEDASQNGNRVAKLAFNSTAPLVIRDGVAYFRDTPGGALTPVLNLIGGRTDTLYPDSSHPQAKRYGDLRWYGWFGMNQGVAPTPDNPARWHFPIKSVTINSTTDANNGGDATTSDEGTAVKFTFRNDTVIDPVVDGVSPGTATWIRRDIDLTGLSGYPGLNSSAGDATTGAGIGMYNVTYPTIEDEGWERFDPVRVGYNIIKAEVSRLYNAHHLYTSRFGEVTYGSDTILRMLNRDGSDPGMNNAPDIWGAGVIAASFGGGTDYNGDGYNEFSAFWSTDGAIGSTSMSTEYRYYRIGFDGSQGGGGFIIAINEMALQDGNNNFPTGGQTLTVSSGAGLKDKIWDNSNGSWNMISNTNEWFKFDFGAGNEISADVLAIKTVNDPNYSPVNIKIEASQDDATWVTIGEYNSLSWSANETKFFPIYRKYSYRRDPTGNTNVLQGQLQLFDSNELQSKVELLPLRHSSLVNMGTAPNSMNDWYIYKSTLPLCNRTLAMPTSRDNLEGWDYSNCPTAGNPNDLVLNPLAAGNRTSNFGWAGLSAADPTYQGWFTMQANAPEMLARRANNGTLGSGITFEVDFGYYAGDVGGYYGNDNLCMIDAQEKKVVVFTEIDLAELTEECFTFNGLDAAWGFNFTNNPASAVDDDALQNIIYVVNTSMGQNFFGKRVHCGAVRLKRGRVMSFPLAIGSPNAVHVWGDYNCPNYWHHGKGGGSTSVSYYVPTAREHEPSNTLSVESCAIYADSIHAYENSWLPFDQGNSSRNSIRDQFNGTFRDTLPTSGDRQERIFFDHKLWWEDDGMRRRGASINTNPVISSYGAQLFLNYHETIFDHNDNNYFASNSAWERQRSSQVWKHIPQGINAALMYGNIESRLPSYFWKVDVDNIPLVRPTSISELDWYMSWIPRSRWVECERDEMRSDFSNTVTNGGFDPTAGTGGSAYQTPPADLRPSNYFGVNFPSSGNTEWENCKLRFSGGGFLYDIKFHTNHTHNLAEWTSGRQTFGRNINGSFACLFQSRQATHGWNTTCPGTENQQMFYAYDLRFNDAANLPPGTPLTTIIPSINYTIEGTKWEY